MKRKADIIFVIDSSGSMQYCIDSVKQNIHEFVETFRKDESEWDLRFDFLAHQDQWEGEHSFEAQTIHSHNVLHDVYHTNGDMFFTSDISLFQSRLATIESSGDESSVLALDTAIDFPFRPQHRCHRCIVFLTDEAAEQGTRSSKGTENADTLVEKLQEQGILLYMVTPYCELYEILEEANYAIWEVVEDTDDGLSNVNFVDVLHSIAKSITKSKLQVVARLLPDRKALFGQNTWKTPEKKELR